MSRVLVRLTVIGTAVSLVLGLGLVTMLMFGSYTLSGSGDSGTGTPARCLSVVTGLGAVRGLDADQLANARTIMTTGAALGVPPRGMTVALATAMQESTLRNLTYGDRDSVGLFQQRPSAGWGTVAELTTPAIAARKFYTALLKVPGWQSMPVTVAAQTVQRSAFPLAYAKWEPLAAQLVTRAGADPGALTCGPEIALTAGEGPTGSMISVALAQQGKPYVWGATGPDAFDCSGLIVYAWRRAGFQLQIRTSEQMYAHSTPVPRGQERPGDLVFSHFESTGPGHVQLVVRAGLAVQAPRTGDVVKLSDYSARSDVRIGRLTPDMLKSLST